MNRQKAILHRVGRHNFSVENAIKDVQKVYLPFVYLDVEIKDTVLDTTLKPHPAGGQFVDISQLDSDPNVLNIYSIPELSPTDTSFNGRMYHTYNRIEMCPSTRERWTNVLIHELSHMFSVKRGIVDRTHEFHPRAASPVQPLIDSIDGYIFKDEKREVLALHHSGSKKSSRETLNGIENHHKTTRADGMVFYDVMIGEGEVREYNRPRFPRGNFHSHDVMLMGDYRTDELSTEDYWRLRGIINDRNLTVVTHGELGELGYGTKTECPGTLLDQYIEIDTEKIPLLLRLLQRKLFLMAQLIISRSDDI